MSVKGRTGARQVLVQALYQMQLTGHDEAQIREDFTSSQEYAAADGAYFDSLLAGVLATIAELDELIGKYGDIPAEQLDPVEHAVLWVALAEIRLSPGVPPKVVLNEAIELAKLFGAEGSHKYVNGLLDKAAVDLLS